MGKLKLKEVTRAAQGHRLSELELDLNPHLWNDHPLTKEPRLSQLHPPLLNAAGLGFPPSNAVQGQLPALKGFLSPRGTYFKLQPKLTEDEHLCHPVSSIKALF